MASTTAANADHHNTTNRHVESNDMVLRYVVWGWFSTQARPVGLLECDGPVRPLCERVHADHGRRPHPLCAGSLGAVARFTSELCDPQVEGDTLSLDFRNGEGWLVLGPPEGRLK